MSPHPTSGCYKEICGKVKVFGGVDTSPDRALWLYRQLMIPPGRTHGVTAVTGTSHATRSRPAGQTRSRGDRFRASASTRAVAALLSDVASRSGPHTTVRSARSTPV